MATMMSTTSDTNNHDDDERKEDDNNNNNNNNNNYDNTIIYKDDIVEPLPSKPTMNTTLGFSHPVFARIQKNGLTLQYYGRANHTHDAGGARTIEPIPVEYQYNYFEVKILHAGTNGDISIGYVDKDAKLNQNIGMTKGKYLYNYPQLFNIYIYIYICKTMRILTTIYSLSH